MVLHSTVCENVTIMSIAAECCWDALFSGLAVLTTFKSDAISTDEELSFYSVILSGVVVGKQATQL